MVNGSGAEMTEVLTSAQMRAIERAAIDSGAVTGLELMERAGQGVVDAIMAEWPDLAHGTPRAVVLCGPGNNGGDGFVVARLLAARGWAVEVFLYGAPERMPPDARANYQRWAALGEVRGIDDLCFRLDSDKGLGADLFVDAVFGTGVGRALPDLVGFVAGKLEYSVARAGQVRRVAVDVPSGLCPDSGRPLAPEGAAIGSQMWEMGKAFLADLTVTFHSAKVGHLLDRGPAFCGQLVVADIGLPLDASGLTAVRLPRVQRVRVAKQGGFHKFFHGHALILGGPSARGGAARLAARGALRIGAGLVTIASPPAAMAENAARLDAIMLRELARSDTLADLLQDRRINALCLGPAMGMGAREAGLLAVALGEPVPGVTRDLDSPGAHAVPGGPGSSPGRGAQGRSVVLDADALTLLAQHPDLFAALHARCVLTPHAGEFARLFPDIAAKLAEPATIGPAFSKVDATRAAAARAGCVVLYKGPDTVIADASGRCAINAAAYDRAAPWLATAGSGDVLAGFITGLLARGFPPFDAACTAAWLHVEAARSFGPGLIAEDLPEELPRVFRRLGL